MGINFINSLSGLAFLFVMTALSPVGLAATDACLGGTERELRFAAEPRDDDEARSRFQQACRESEKDRNKVKCGDETHSACYCQHMEIRRQARQYIQKSRESCAQATAAERAATCESNSNAETCQRSAANVNEVTTRSETEMAALAGQARESTDEGERRVAGLRREVARELEQTMALPAEDLRRPVPR